jgi:hypothetical protein
VGISSPHAATLQKRNGVSRRCIEQTPEEVILEEVKRSSAMGRILVL